MDENISARIKAFCERSNIDIPPGFQRQPAARYALIDLSLNPHKLIARTWFKPDGVIAYLAQHGGGRSFLILDFREQVELRLSEDNDLVRSRDMNSSADEPPANLLMAKYLNLSGNSGVLAYAVQEGAIIVQFVDGHAYLYTDRSAGEANIREMQALAERGRGLSTFISRTVKDGYERKCGV